MKKIALVSGITGQDGSYLAEFLIKKGYVVHGIKRKSSSFNTGRLDHLYIDPHNKTNFFLHYGDLTDSNSIYNLIAKIKPNEIYNLGAQSHVGVSFENPEYTAQVTGLGALRILESMRFLKLKKTKFYQASTSDFLEKLKKIKNISMKNLALFQNLPTGHQNYFHIGLQKFTENLMEFLHAMEFYLIMKVQGEEKHL